MHATLTTYVLNQTGWIDVEFNWAEKKIVIEFENVFFRSFRFATAHANMCMNAIKQIHVYLQKATACV